jgi:hypothetical protein
MQRLRFLKVKEQNINLHLAASHSSSSQFDFHLKTLPVKSKQGVLCHHHAPTLSVRSERTATYEFIVAEATDKRTVAE